MVRKVEVPDLWLVDPFAEYLLGNKYSPVVVVVPHVYNPYGSRCEYCRQLLRTAIEAGAMYYYILVTEEVNIPPDLLPFDVNFRSTFHRFGWVGRVSNIGPGFRGRIHVMLWGPPEAPMLQVKKGARILQVRFLKLEKPLEGYAGQWQGV